MTKECSFCKINKLLMIPHLFRSFRFCERRAEDAIAAKPVSLQLMAKH